MRHSAKQSLGQNFLVDDNIARKIMHVFSPHQDEFIVEIGSGKGALTHYLAELGVETLGIELDESLVEHLRGRFGGEPGITIRHENILDTDFAAIARETEKTVRVLGNIPYNITSPLLFHLLEHRDVVRDVMIMVQEEIGERLTADPGTKAYGILSVLLQTYADCAIEFKTSRHVYRPKPKVGSAMVSIRWHDRWIQHLPDRDLYRIVVRTAFGKRRKTLRNALNYLPFTGFDTDILEFDTGLRAEKLGIRDFLLLTKEIAEKYPNYPEDIEDSDL